MYTLIKQVALDYLTLYATYIHTYILSVCYMSCFSGPCVTGICLVCLVCVFYVWFVWVVSLSPSYVLLIVSVHLVVA